MRNLWDANEAKEFEGDLGLRVYTSNLLGKSDELVLHGGGNTSVKSVVDGEDILFVKGSGWDLVSIKAEGFAPVKLDALKNMATFEVLSDSDMVRLQKEAMIDKSAPNPSVEAILHAIIPYKFVDHTHADAMVTISNSTNGEDLIRAIYPNFLIIPYVMPGFILAKTIYEMTQNFDWEKCDGIVLLNHGIFTFDDDGKKSYDKMIKEVNKAEKFLAQKAPLVIEKYYPRGMVDIESLVSILSKEKGYEIAINVNQSPLALHYASMRSLREKACRGVLTPEHIIRTKRTPMILENSDIQKAVDEYKTSYIEYFNSFAKDEIMLNPAPNYVVVKDFGVISIGKTQKEADIINDIITHTMGAVLRADMLGGYESISMKDSFDMEYWELEQVKLRK
ncbi:class II aldolase/adducin family protein [Arcobacter sp. FWKO B]|uniref:class II aldolase/adducin family protein n=1 Tax=Arcobacter sp. FWKO B TaxID=2593672 RepID=UPI0018A5413F|nr:class II aldolase/adducin family protein [Arcobacter sp. FWKO B]QOG11841.1 oxidoreductase [Arcobacter sp. FWKO B]